MADLFSAMSDDETPPPAPPAPPPAPEQTAPEAAPPPAPEQTAPEAAPPPAAPRKLPAGVLDAKPPPQGHGEKAKAKAKAKTERVSHENRERFAAAFGPALDKGLNVVAASFGSHVRADVTDPDDPRNALVFTVKFAGKSATLDTRREGVKEAIASARETFSALLSQDTPGRSVAYHLAGVAPGVANIETWLEEHPWTTLALVSLATVGQFSMRVAQTAAQAPVVIQNKATDGA